jgi:hypothetical protein
MTLWRRLLYALAFVAVLNAIGILVLVFLAPNVLRALMSEMHWFVLLELAVVMPFAPALSRYLPQKRGEA